eukprot:m.140872 g.140872  ORF g.140872 m.140872 type:complete len:123 (-) comp17096_c0_seq1:177-545(-)
MRQHGRRRCCVRHGRRCTGVAGGVGRSAELLNCGSVAGVGSVAYNQVTDVSSWCDSDTQHWCVKSLPLEANEAATVTLPQHTRCAPHQLMSQRAGQKSSLGLIPSRLKPTRSGSCTPALLVS